MFGDGAGHELVVNFQYMATTVHVNLLSVLRKDLRQILKRHARLGQFVRLRPHHRKTLDDRDTEWTVIAHCDCSFLVAEWLRVGDVLIGLQKVEVLDSACRTQAMKLDGRPCPNACAVFVKPFIGFELLWWTERSRSDSTHAAGVMANSLLKTGGRGSCRAVHVWKVACFLRLGRSLALPTNVFQHAVRAGNRLMGTWL